MSKSEGENGSSPAVAAPIASKQTAPTATHTPGPWVYRPNRFDDWGVVRAGGVTGYFVAQAQAGRHLTDQEAQAHRVAKTDPFEANARLIAAAPDLLAALKVARSHVQFFCDETDDEGTPDCFADLALIDAALSKAQESSADERDGAVGPSSGRVATPSPINRATEG